MKYAIATITSIVGLSFAGLALADETPKFEEVDSNKDGTISKSEAVVVSNLDFAAADSNKDGVLSRSEYESAVG